MTLEEYDAEWHLTEAINRDTRTSDIVFIACLITMGVIGNILIISSVIVTKKLRNTTNIFVCNVAVSDFLVAGYVLPTILGNIIKQDSVLRREACVFTACILLTSCGVSLISFSMIAFNRFVSICHHGLYGRIFTNRKVVAMVIMVWVFSVSTVIIGLIPGVAVHFYHHAQLVCTFNNRLSVNYTFALLCVGIVGPSVLTGSFYFMILRKIKTAGRKVRAHNAGVLTNAMLARQQKENRAVLCMFIAFLVFVFLWFPFGVVVLVDIHSPVHPILFRAVGWLAFSNSCLDWIIYGGMNSNFREGYRNVFTCFRRKRGDGRSEMENSAADSGPGRTTRVVVATVSTDRSMVPIIQ